MMAMANVAPDAHWLCSDADRLGWAHMASLRGSRAGGIRGADGGDGGMGSTAGSSDDEGDSTPMMQMWKRYEQLLEETPLLMKALTSLTGFALGDILAQKVIQKVDSFDFLRLLRLASFGFLVHGTSSHVFYGWLDGKFPGTSAQVVFAKVLVDQVFWAPIFGMMFFSYIAAAELKGLGNVFDKMKDELVTQVDGVPVPRGPLLTPTPPPLVVLASTVPVLPECLARHSAPT
jgi:protein Mpv17